MAIDKALYAAPQGLDSLSAEESPIEIEIVNPEGVSIGIDGVEIDLMPEDETAEESFDSNLAEHMEESDLQKVAGDIMELVEADINSRKDWADTYVKGLTFLGCVMTT